VIEPDVYAWLEDDESLLAVDGFALVLVESPASALEVVTIAGLRGRELPPGAVDAGEVTRIGRLGGWLTFLEPNGGLLAMAAGPASQAGRVVGFAESIDAGMQFVLAEGGAMRRSFDPLLDEPGEGYGRALPEESGLPFGGIDDPVVAAAFALMERITGQRITPAWLQAQNCPLLVIER
jgi:Family of unknown function (DUF6461)